MAKKRNRIRMVQIYPTILYSNVLVGFVMLFVIAFSHLLIHNKEKYYVYEAEYLIVQLDTC